VESEELAKRVAGEPDNRARIRKAYQLIFGRDPKEDEIKLGIAYLHEEPMKEYEENKNKPPEGGGRGGRGGRGGDTSTPPTATSDAAKPEAAPAAIAAAEDGGAGAAAAAPAAENPMGMGMMGGMGGFGGFGGRRGATPGRPPQVKYEPTAWGRYAKILLSSSEFFFIN